MRRAIQATSLRVGLCLGLAAPACGGDDEQPQAESDGEVEEDDADDESGEPPALGDQCEDTILLVEAPSTLAATLRNASVEESGIAAACGLSGPIVFAELALHDRADLSVSARGRAYTPRFAVLQTFPASGPGALAAGGF